MKNVFKKTNLTPSTLWSTLLLCFIFTVSLSAQEASDHNREVGIRASGLNDFNLIYKRKKGENKFRRIRVGTANIAFRSNQNTQSFNLQTNLAIGIEKRKPINNKFYFIHGTEFLGGLGISATENRGTVSISTGVGFVIGFQYAISNSFYVSLETIPSVRASFLIDEDGFRDPFDIDAGFNSQAASLSLVYQFKARKKEG